MVIQQRSNIPRVARTGWAIPILVLMFGFPRLATACFQLDDPFVHVNGDVIAGKVSLNGKPIGAAKLILRVGPKDRKVRSNEVTRVITNKDGSFSFGPQPVGLYWIEMTQPSAESVRLVLTHDNKLPNSKIDMAYTADFCHDYKAY